MISTLYFKRQLILLCWRIHGCIFAGRRLALTYNPHGLTDGGGNQALRIAAIRALANLLRVEYLHTPISRIDYRGVISLAGPDDSAGNLDSWNKLVCYDSTFVDYSDAEFVGVDELKLSHLFQVARRSAAHKRLIILSITNPFPVSDFFPRCYASLIHCMGRPRLSRASSSPLRIAIHVRRGDLLWTHSDRLLPIQYYYDVLHRMIAILEALQINYECELYSEEPTSPLTLQPGDHGISHGSEAAVVIDPASSDLHRLDSIHHLLKFINFDPVESIRRMASADILVTSRSAFSYLAAINNRNGIIIYHPFWHPRLPGWIQADQITLFSESAFRRCLRRLLTSTQ